MHLIWWWIPSVWIKETTNSRVCIAKKSSQEGELPRTSPYVYENDGRPAESFENICKEFDRNLRCTAYRVVTSEIKRKNTQQVPCPIMLKSIVQVDCTPWLKENGPATSEISMKRCSNRSSNVRSCYRRERSLLILAFWIWWKKF